MGISLVEPGNMIEPFLPGSCRSREVAAPSKAPGAQGLPDLCVPCAGPSTGHRAAAGEMRDGTAALGPEARSSPLSSLAGQGDSSLP